MKKRDGWHGCTDDLWCDELYGTRTLSWLHMRYPWKKRRRVAVLSYRRPSGSSWKVFWVATMGSFLWCRYCLLVLHDLYMGRLCFWRCFCGYHWVILAAMQHSVLHGAGGRAWSWYMLLGSRWPPLLRTYWISAPLQYIVLGIRPSWHRASLVGLAFRIAWKRVMVF